MQRCLFVVIGLAACGRVDFDPVAQSGDDAPPFADRDNDGIADDIDNCVEVANPGQENEDHDALGDACDPCPPFVDTVPPTDPDDDGVSGNCDPSPDVPGDEIVLFDGFDATPSGAQIDGTWTFDGTARVTSSLDEESAVTYVVPDAPTHHVSTRVTPDEYFGDLVARPIGVVTQYHKDTRDGTMCVFGINPSNQEVVAIADNRATLALAAKDCDASLGTTADFRMREHAGAYECASSQIITPLTTTSTLLSTPNRIGVFARSTSAHFEWVMIVASP